jgi:hypothetical protein
LSIAVAESAYAAQRRHALLIGGKSAIAAAAHLAATIIRTPRIILRFGDAAEGGHASEHSKGEQQYPHDGLLDLRLRLPQDPLGTCDVAQCFVSACLLCSCLSTLIQNKAARPAGDNSPGPFTVTRYATGDRQRPGLRLRADHCCAAGRCRRCTDEECGPDGGTYCVFGSQAPPMPLIVAMHCAWVEKPQFVPPKSPP